MEYPVIGFIGGGNMATSIIGGLIANGCPKEKLLVSDPLEENRSRLKASGVAAFEANGDVASRAELLILAVKPQVMANVARDLSTHIAHRPVVVSIAAGISVDALKSWLGGETPVIRCMPNTPALLQQGASGLFASEECTALQREQAEAVLRAVGIVEWVDQETLIDVITAISGSGPAYFFLIMELMEKIGAEMGLDGAAARKLTVQTALGAARMAGNDDIDLSELRLRVTSPGGTTEQAIKSFIDGNIEELFRDAMKRCYDRAEEMAREFQKGTNQ